MRVLMIVGPATAKQGWGSRETTRFLQDALVSRGFLVDELWIESYAQLTAGLESRRFDIVWSGLYFAAAVTQCFGAPPGEPWIADELDARGIPYVGSTAAVVKLANSKHATLRCLADADIPVPAQQLVPLGSLPGPVRWPAFVKPCYESESAGVSEASVVTSADELHTRVKYIHDTFREDAVVEDFLPGREVTISVLGNGEDALIRPLTCVVRRDGFDRYPVLCDDHKEKGEDIVSFEIPEDSAKLQALARRVIAATGARDHSRIDAREDANGQMRILELNAIPALGPRASRAARIHALYARREGGDGSYADLVDRVLTGALGRYGMKRRALE